MWSELFVQYMVCRRMKHVYMRVAEGRITCRVYMIYRRENNICTSVLGKGNHVSDFLGRYRSI
jgi:hypothetical protein